MSRRITVVLDDDVIDALDLLCGRSVSARVNDALKAAIATQRHRVAVLAWLAEMSSELGVPDPAHYRAAEDLLDELGVSPAGDVEAA